jgi:hypothetical protein
VYPWPDKSANWDGVVEKGGKTDKFLRKTALELAEKNGTDPKQLKLCQVPASSSASPKTVARSSRSSSSRQDL